MARKYAGYKRAAMGGAVLGLSLFFAGMANAEEASAAGDNPCAASVNGVWKSSAGSTLTIAVKGNLVSGTFDKPGVGKSQIVGSIATPTSGNCPLSFSASWPASGTFYSNVTSYTGEFEKESGSIRTVFLYVNPTVPGYQAVSVGTDFFTKK